MQKAVFLVTQGTRAANWAGSYEYQPYNWGPYSTQLSEDLANWQRQGVMVLSFAGGVRYGRYVLTRDGSRLARELMASVSPNTLRLLTEVRSWVTSKDFNRLLREVYEEFPGYATKSRWSGPR